MLFRYLIRKLNLNGEIVLNFPNRMTHKADLSNLTQSLQAMDWYFKQLKGIIQANVSVCVCESPCCSLHNLCVLWRQSVGKSGINSMDQCPHAFTDPNNVSYCNCLWPKGKSTSDGEINVFLVQVQMTYSELTFMFVTDKNNNISMAIKA